MKDSVVHIVITDFQLPDIDGLEIIDRLAKLDAKIIPIMMTGFGTIETAVRAMKSGAFDFITKPFDLEAVAVVIRKAAEVLRLRQENHLLRKAVRDQYRLEHLVGHERADVMEFVRARLIATVHYPRRERDRQGIGGSHAPSIASERIARWFR